MRTMLARVGLAASALLLVAGCSSVEATVKPTGPFDPCQIDDGVIRKAGFDPGNRTTSSAASAGQRCQFRGLNSGGVLLLSHPAAVPTATAAYDRSLTSAESEATQRRAQPPVVTKVNGRDAFTTQQVLTAGGVSLPLSCATTLRTKDSVLNVQISGDNTCDQSVHAAQILEPAIGDR
ncbi:hypothetical protein [Nocardia sp. NBC_00511]|uniref:hypothetical protein n=1 Tax=Nocardia sp. NBC_00511 TaxID=2903591 RepID=UPI0030E44137